jgi:hypothetical protein
MVSAMHDEMLDFYRKQSIISDPGKFAEYYENLPNSIPELCNMVQNAFNHIFWIKDKKNYGITVQDIIALGRDPNKELNMRNIEEKLTKYFSIDKTSFIEPREQINKLVGNCRDYALFLVSMLRYKGIPARVRSGSARYFFPPEMERFEDHYICEYWNDEDNQWHMVDPQIDDVMRKALNMNISTTDLPYDQFLGAGQTWKEFRKGKIKPENFGIGEWRGQIFVFEKLIMELASLNKIEVLAWERWGVCGDLKNLEKLGVEFFDKLADKISKVNNPEIFFELKDLFEKDPRFKVPIDYKPWFMKFDF